MMKDGWLLRDREVLPAIARLRLREGGKGKEGRKMN
jgi:hypothetical protein